MSDYPPLAWRIHEAAQSMRLLGGKAHTWTTPPEDDWRFDSWLTRKREVLRNDAVSAFVIAGYACTTPGVPESAITAMVMIASAFESIGEPESAAIVARYAQDVISREAEHRARCDEYDQCLRARYVDE